MVDLSIPEFGVHLVGGKEIVEGRPHPNKNYLVVSPKSSRRMLVGLLFELEHPHTSFVCTTRWAISADRVAEHVVHYEIVDEDYTAATSRMCLWGGSADKGHETRSIEAYSNYSPMQAEPRMWVGEPGIANARCSNLEHDEHEKVVRRVDHFKMPTIQRDRLDPSTCLWHRQPGFETAWLIG